MKYESNKSNNLSDKIVWLLTMLLLASFYIFASETWGAYIMLGTTIVIFFIYAYQREMKIPKRLDKFHYVILAFIAYVAMSSIWAQDSILSLEKAITLIEILICISVLYIYYNTEKGVEILLNIIMWAGYVVTLYTFGKYGFDYISSFVHNSMRFEDAFANVNSIAMFVAVSVIVAVYRTLYKKISISIIFCLPAIYLIAATGSRKALVMMVVGVILLLIIRFASRNVVLSILKIVVLLFLLYKIVPLIMSLEMFSGINSRMEGLIALVTHKGTVDHSSWLRQQYILVGLEQFKKTPILGIGIGNASILLKQTIGSGTYLHNNYVELLACGGLIGIIVYYRIYLTPMHIFLKNIKFRSPETIVCLILMVILLIMDYGSVSYYYKETYFYIMLFYIEMNMLIKHKYELSEEEEK